MNQGTSALQLEKLFEVIEGGKQVGAGEIIQFPTDSVAGETLTGISEAVELGNGAATEVSQLTLIEGGASSTAGIGLLSMEIPVVGGAIAAALGVVAGVGLYNLAPEFWTNVSNTLVEAGETVGGKVRGFINGVTQQVGLSENTIEIFKQAFIDAGIFEVQKDATAYPSEYVQNHPPLPIPLSDNISFTRPGSYVYNWKYTDNSDPVYSVLYLTTGNEYTGIFYSKSPFKRQYYVDGQLIQETNAYSMSAFGKTFYYTTIGTSAPLSYYSVGKPYDYDIGAHGDMANTGYIILFGTISQTGNVQEGAILPDTNPFPHTYPTWLPWQLPAGMPANVPNIYPIEVPVNNPDPTQAEAQNPAPAPSPSPWLEWLLDNLPVPDPVPDPVPVPPPAPDPDPTPDPEPIPVPDPVPVDPDPINPNPDPVPGPTPIIPILPSTVDSNAMFTVYRPSMSQINSFGSWLWSSNIIDQLLRMWSNPLDGIIAFQKVYASPSVGSSSNIIVGYLDSNVPAPIVTSQFTTVDCGTVNVSELMHNCTDYSPYSSLHLYLPFIGIVELDVDEFMNGQISVKYSIDVYTGTCLAEVKAIRSPDMPSATIIYTFSGNASQQLPLTSANFAGALSSLVSAIGAGITIASGGGAVAGAVGVAHSLTHEMIHIGHSGALSANAGIMASRFPYIIISHRQNYDANGYNELYGYPVNKTVFLGNCRGYTRIKAGMLQSAATEAEKDEIMSLLKKGVIF